MYLTVKQQLKHLSKKDYKTLKKLCHTAKNLTNEAIYNARQHFFNEEKYLSYTDNYKMLKNSEKYTIRDIEKSKNRIVDYLTSA